MSFPVNIRDNSIIAYSSSYITEQHFPNNQQTSQTISEEEQGGSNNDGSSISHSNGTNQQEQRGEQSVEEARQELRSLRSRIILKKFLFWLIRMIPIIILLIVVNTLKHVFVHEKSLAFILIDIALWLSFVFLIVLSSTSIAMNYCNALKIEAVLAYEGLPSMNRTNMLSNDNQNFEIISDCPLCLYVSVGENVSSNMIQQLSALSSNVNWCSEHGKLVVDPPPDYEAPPSYEELCVIKTIAA